MIIEKELLALSDVAKLCRTSSSNISNWRNRDPKFPMPYTDTSAGPIWKSEDIVTYLKNKLDSDYDVMATRNLVTKRVAVIGRARGGKSFFVSRFVADRKGFIKLFCGNSSDKTACPIYTKISEHVILENFVFHTDFNTIYKDDDFMELRSKVSNLTNHAYLQDETDKMIEIEKVIREIRKIEKDHPKGRSSNTYIDTFQRPGIFCKELLRECKIGTIEIVDTPGVSGNVEAAKISKSDIYTFLLKPDNTDEAETLTKIVSEVKSDVATSKVIFLYKKEGIIFKEKQYQNAKASAREDMRAYDELFKEFRKNIISTELNILQPSKYCIPFPTMGEEDIEPPEEFFIKDIKEKLIEAFKGETKEVRDNEFMELVLNNKDEIRNFVLGVMNGIPCHKFDIREKIFTVEEIRAGRHDRVMTKDNYRLHSSLYNAYREESGLLDSYFNALTADEYPEEWQQIIIKYIYRELTSSIRRDRGLGVGTHHWEESPARTMLVQESIFADKILDNIVQQDALSKNIPYRKALIDNGITSGSWNYVGCTDNEEALIKLKIIKECLLDINVSSREKMVLCRYVGGLRKIAQYKILELLGYEEDECIKELKEMTF